MPPMAVPRTPLAVTHIPVVPEADSLVLVAVGLLGLAAIVITRRR
jgi:hypothetical protein